MKQVIQFNTIIGCGNNCVYCPQKTIIGSYKKISDETVMSVDTFSKCLKNLPGDMVLAFGGFSEPFLNRDCVSMIMIGYGLGHPVIVNTTLMGLTKNDVSVLKDLDFDEFLVHLPNKTDNFFVFKQGYLSILDNVCGSIGGLSFVYFNELDDDIRFVVENHGYSPFNGMLSSVCGLVSEPVNVNGAGFCEMKYNRRHIVLPNGDVMVCCKDWGLKHYIGNLLSEEYRVLHKNSDWKCFKKQMKHSGSDIICRNCEFFVPYFSLRIFKYLSVKLLNQLGYNYYRRKK